MSDGDGGKTAIVIMAAGKGTRMKSSLPKALLPLGGRPMLARLLDTAGAIPHDRIVVVVGHKKEMVMKETAAPGVRFAVQEPQLGTGHAVAQARVAMEGFHGDVLVLSSDAPLIRPETLNGLLSSHRRSGAAVTVLTFEPEDPGAYGRVLRDGERITAIVEAGDASPEHLGVREVNSGVYVFKSSFLFAALDELDNDNAQGEYYLTDLINIAVRRGAGAVAVKTRDPAEVMGANTAADLEKMERLLAARERAS